METTRACPICGGAIARKSAPATITVGRRTAVVEDEYFECQDCGEAFVTPEQMDRVQRRASDEIRRREGLLLPEEILAVRTELGLSQAAFERMLGVGAKTVVRWEKGTVFQNPATDSLLRLIRADRENAKLLAQRNRVQLAPTASSAPARRLGSAGGSPRELIRKGEPE